MIFLGDNIQKIWLDFRRCQKKLSKKQQQNNDRIIGKNKLLNQFYSSKVYDACLNVNVYFVNILGV